MKRVLVILLAILLLPALACAAWNVNVTWTESTGPDLAYTRVWLDVDTPTEDMKCAVLPGETPVCNFQVPDITGQVVTVRSTNTINVFSDVSIVLGTIAPSTGMSVTCTFTP